MDHAVARDVQAVQLVQLINFDLDPRGAAAGGCLLPNKCGAGRAAGIRPVAFGGLLGARWSARDPCGGDGSFASVLQHAS